MLILMSQVSRFLANLKCTLETALNYAKEKRKKLAEITGGKGTVHSNSDIVFAHESWIGSTL